jgi:CubicO group peptidase (beta-lactamase class C family)
MPILVVILGFFTLLTLPAAAQGVWTAAKTAEVDQLVEFFMQPRHGGVRPPALSIVVGLDGERVVAKGYGEARLGVPADEDTVYHIGSLTKQFTAAAMLRVIEQGARAPLTGRRLTLDTPMSDIFHGVDRWTGADDPPVTVRRLLNMTSNLPNFTRRPPPGSDPWGAVETPQLLDALKRVRQHGWPNTFEYSNTGYFLVARIVEATQVARSTDILSHHEYVRRVLLAPLGLEQTGFVGDGFFRSTVALGHFHRRPAFTQPNWLDGSGDMASSAADLFRWNAALIEGRVLDQESTRAMFAEGGRVDPVRFYGMGWFVTSDEGWDSYSHSGSVPGYTSYNLILRHPRSGGWVSVTLLANSDGIEGLDTLADEIAFVARRR